MIKIATNPASRECEKKVAYPILTVPHRFDHPQKGHQPPTPGAAIARCDRALGWNACGEGVACYKKFATTASHQFFPPRACFHPKTAAHCAVAVPGGGGSYKSQATGLLPQPHGPRNHLLHDLIRTPINALHAGIGVGAGDGVLDRKSVV